MLAVLSIPANPQIITSNNELIYVEGSEVIITHNRNGELLSEQKVHNVLYDEGKNLTRQALFGGGIGSALNISLCNATAGCGIPIADASETWNVINSVGLESVEGTYYVNSTTGSFSIAHTFTANDTISVNASRLGNLSGSNLSGFNFSILNMGSADQLTINYTGAIS